MFFVAAQVYKRKRKEIEKKGGVSFYILKRLSDRMCSKK